MTDTREPDASAPEEGDVDLEPQRRDSTAEMARPLTPEEFEERDEWVTRLASARWLALRPSKVQIAALVLLSVFALGPIVAMVLILSADRDPSTPILISDGLAPSDGAQVVGTITRVDAVAGELALRLLVLPQTELVENGRLAEPLVLRLNDARGNTSFTFPAGEVPAPIETTLALSGGSVSRYPFDSYEAGLALVLQTEQPAASDPADGSDADAPETEQPEPTPIPVIVDLVTTVTDFELVAELAVDDDPNGTGDDAAPESSATFNLVDLQVSRTQTTTVYAMGIMALMWGLAVTGVLMAWAVVIWRVDTPVWVYGYFVGVLFALPPLREALPGRPPPGTLVDYAAFYWSIGIIGVTLLLLMSLWIRRARPEDRPRLFSRTRTSEVDPVESADEPISNPVS